MPLLSRLQSTGLVLATHNEGKRREIAALLAPLGINVKSAKELNLEEPEETGKTFAENAALKAENAAAHANMPALADDSGLVIPAIGGAPGIYSARWAGPEKDFAHAFRRIERELNERMLEPTGTPAFFVCALALTFPGEKTRNFRGEAHGTLRVPPRGKGGFGYDPIFVPEGESRSFAEMEPEQKEAISHRTKAFRQLMAVLES